MGILRNLCNGNVHLPVTDIINLLLLVKLLHKPKVFLLLLSFLLKLNHFLYNRIEPFYRTCKYVYSYNILSFESNHYIYNVIASKFTGPEFPNIPCTLILIVALKNLIKSFDKHLIFINFLFGSYSYFFFYYHWV